MLRGLGDAFHADRAGTGRRANAEAVVKAMTDGEMNVRDMPSSKINQMALATSEISDGAGFGRF